MACFFWTSHNTLVGQACATGHTVSLLLLLTVDQQDVQTFCTLTGVPRVPLLPRLSSTMPTTRLW